MRAILLAAGKGSRISNSIPEIPKSTLEINGIPLILRTIEMLQKNNIQCVVVVGYKHEIIERILKDKDVKIVYNPFFDVTNSIGSLYFAKDYITDDDTIIGNADVFYNQDILDILFGCDNSATLLSDKTKVKTGDYFFKTENGIIKKYGKELTINDRDCEYVGLALIKAAYISKFKQRLIDLVSNQQHNLWWENVLYSLSEEEPIYTKDVNGLFWSEIDYLDDYQRILKHLS